MRMRTPFLWSMTISLSLAALLGILALLLPSYGPEEEILGSTALFGVFSLVALMCATVLEKRRLVHLMWTGIGASGAALLGWLVLIWFDRALAGRQEFNVARTAGTFTVLAVFIAECGLLSLPRFDRPAANRVRWTTVGVSILFAVTILNLIWLFEWIERVIDEEIVVRGMGVLAILTACGTVVTPILWKMEAVRRAGSVESISLKVRVQITCPRCQTPQELMTGPGRCRACGLRIKVDVEEPRCVCGYLLYQLESDRCPECGRDISEIDRWLAGEPPAEKRQVP